MAATNFGFSERVSIRHKFSKIAAHGVLLPQSTKNWRTPVVLVPTKRKNGLRAFAWNTFCGRSRGRDGVSAEKRSHGGHQGQRRSQRFWRFVLALAGRAP